MKPIVTPHWMWPNSPQIRIDMLEKRVSELEDALTEAHRILLHEMDNGRTPTMLQGVGLGYFEDVLSHVAHTVKGIK